MTNSVKTKNASLSRRILLLFTIVFSVQILYFGAITMMVQETSQHVETEKKVEDVLSILGNLLRRFHELTIELGYHDPAKPEPRSRSQDRIVDDCKRLQKLLKDDAKYTKTMDEILFSVSEINTIFDRIRGNQITPQSNMVMSGSVGSTYLGNSDWYSLYMRAEEVLTRLKQIQEDFIRVENDTQKLIERQSSFAFTMTLILGFLVTAGVAFALYRMFITGLSNRLSAVADDMVDLAGGKPLKPLEAAGDEIGTLSLALRKVEKTLSELISKETALLNNSASFLCSVTDTGTFLQVSSASKVLWGMAPDQFLGREMSSVINAEDVDSTMSALEKLFRDGRDVSFENRVTRADGSSVELAWKGRLTENRKIAVLVAHDVTKRNKVQDLIRKSEEEFQNMVNEMPIAVVTCDGVYAMSSVNRTTETMFKYPKKEMLGKSLGLILTGNPSIAGDTVSQLNELAARAKREPIELSARCRDRTQIPVEMNMRHYEMQTADTTLVTFQDVSARFEIERVKRDFVAMISHDVRSPLTALSGTLDMISSMIEDSDRVAEGLVKSAHSKVSTLVQLMNDFLDLEKFESGMALLELESVHLHDFLSAVADDVEDKNPRVVLSVACDSEISISVERERFQLALFTLIGLIAQCTIGDGTLRIIAGRTPEFFEIRTGGAPSKVPAALKDAIFSRYVFLSPQATGSGWMSGLSLALARAIIEAHRGLVRIETENDMDVLVVEIATASGG